MAVTGTVSRLHTTPYPAADIRFPTLRFTMGIAVVGDATMGLVTGNLRVAASGSRPSGLVYGVRLLGASINGLGGDLVIVARNFRQGESQAIFSAIGWTIADVALGGISFYQNALGRWLLGIPETVAGDCEIRFQWETNTDTAVYNGYMEGFIWEPGALYQGGPLWPGEHPT